MSKWVIEDSTLTGIANAIRAKKGTSGAIEVTDLASEISTITTEPEIELRATFNNQTPASADGTIYLESNDSAHDGTYEIYWGDANGVMSNYSKIGEIAVSSANKKPMGSIKLMEYNAIPKYATKICAVKNGSVVTDFDIPSAKLWASGNYGEHLYSFGLLSDVHVQYTTGHNDVQVAMTYLNDREGVDAICIVGDLTKNGTVAHLEEWKTDRDTWASNTPVYSCVGNHEAHNTDAIMYANKTQIRQYLDTDWTNETEAYFVKVINNDVFVFTSIFEDTYQNANNIMFTSAELAWLEDVLETYRNQRLFLFAHVPPHWETDGIKYNGFGNGNGAYSYDIWGNPYNANKPLADRTSFLNLLDHYKNVIWLSGHSHIKYEYQHIWDNLNVMRFNNGARLLHVSSLTVPRDIIDGSVSDLIYAESEGAVVDVYPNVIRVRSRNFVGEKFLGYCEYLLDTTPVIIPPKTKTLVSITATKTKTAYYTDETLSTADITVTATYSDSTTEDVSSSAVYNTSNVDLSSAGTYTIGISYTYEGVTETTSIQVTSEARPSSFQVLFDATYTGTLTVADETIMSITSNNALTRIEGNNKYARIDLRNSEYLNQPLYYRLVTNDGVDQANRVGFIGNARTYNGSTETGNGTYINEYSLTSTEWVPLLQKNSTDQFMLTEEEPIFHALFKASSSSTATFPITVNTRLQIGVAVSGPTVVLDATFNGTLTGVSKSISNAVANNATTQVGGTSNKFAGSNEISMLGKPLYYRLLSDTGISYSDKVGLIVTTANAIAGGGSTAAKMEDYSATATDWTPMISVTTGAGSQITTTSECPYIIAQCKSSSSSTATFPVSVNARLQIGYYET